MNQRTVQEFVEDLISDGKSPNQVLIIAQSTCWKNRMDEVRKWIIKLRRRMKKRKM